MSTTIEQNLIKKANRAMRIGSLDEARQLYMKGLSIPGPLGRQCEFNLKLLDLRLKNLSSRPTVSPRASDPQRSILTQRERGDCGKINVDVIVPVYNALDHVTQCLEALIENSDYCNVTTIVVNDGSDDETRTWLRSWTNTETGNILIEHEKNLGYTKAVNSGIKASSADFLVLLNSDTVVTPGWLIGCLRCMHTKPGVDLVGPLSNAASWQSVPSIKCNDGSAFAVNEIPSHISLSALSKFIQASSTQVYPKVKFLNGFCLMFKRAVVDAIGLFDEEAFPTGYGEENDFCIRAYNAGFKLAVADDSFVFHAKSKSFGHEKRIELSRAGSQALRDKHGTSTISDALTDTETAVGLLSPLRKAVEDFLETPERFQRHTTAPNTINPVLFSPIPAFALPDFNLEPSFSGPALVLPYSPENVAGRCTKAFKVGVHLHLYYSELLDEFLSLLENIPVQFDLFVSATDSTVNDRILIGAKKIRNLSAIEVRICKNRGRDIAPMIIEFGSSLSAYDIVCHIHSKKSPHNLSKRDWRRQLLHNLLGSPALVSSILQLFDENPSLGMVFPEYHWSLNRQIGWGTNYTLCEELAERMGISISPLTMSLFPAGSMFWARGKALMPLWKSGLRDSDFPSERAQIDSTPAHAIERLFGEIVVNQNFDLLQIAAEKPHNLKYYYPAKWPYPPQDPKALSDRVSSYLKSKHIADHRVPIFTAITGGYEKPLVHEVLDPWADYLLYTDSETANMGLWDTKALPVSSGEPLLDARLTKASADILFPEAALAIWIDGNVLIRDSMDRFMRSVSESIDYPVFGIPHPVRNCAYAEAERVKLSGKANVGSVERQMRRYRAEGFPACYGLIETNLLIFNLKHPMIGRVLQEWRHELKTETRRDQLSLNYVLWKLNLDWYPIMEEAQSLRDHPGFAYMGHGENSGYSIRQASDWTRKVSISQSPGERRGS